MDAASCQMCGRLYMKQTRSPYCPSCNEVDYDNFIKVRDFIREPANKQTTIGALVGATGVSELDITRYIHEGRLIIKDHPELAISCVRCGQPTNEGKVCSRCQQDMQQELSSLQESLMKQSNARAYRLD